MVPSIWDDNRRKAVSPNKRDYTRHKQGYACYKCGTSLKRGGHLHHRNGNPGDNNLGNLQLWCTKCHREKTAQQAKERAKRRRMGW